MRSLNAQKIVSVGLAPEGEVCVENESGDAQPAYTAGEVVVHGAHVTGGYWDDDAKHCRTLQAAPTLRIGDLGFVDTEGDLFITGRVKDLIVVCGRNL